MLLGLHRAAPSSGPSPGADFMLPPRSPSEATRAKTTTAPKAKKESENGVASRAYRGFMAPKPASWRAVRNAPTSAGPRAEEEGPREDAHPGPDVFVRERVGRGVVGRGLDEGESGAHPEHPYGDQNRRCSYER
jgi:hypothetical protein